MNLSLIDPADLVHDYPETITRSLKNGFCTTIRFNHLGDFLASGRADGTIIVYDIETNAVARKLKGHSRQVQSLSWSKNGRYLLSAALDWKAIIWDLKDGSRLRVVRFNAPPYSAELQPRKHLVFVVSLLLEEPLLVDCTGRIPINHPLPTEGPPPQDGGARAKKPDSTTYAIWAPDGSQIISGTEKGNLNIIDASSHQLQRTHPVAGGRITSIKLHQPTDTVLLNSGDKVIRRLSVSALLDPETSLSDSEHIAQYEDMINHLSWNNMCCSHTGDHILASIYMQWKAYIWDRHSGSLVKIIDGPSEELGAIEWHPTKPLICGTGIESGAVHVWSIVQPQRWAALAPDFVEVEESAEYEEREDEFDVQDEEMMRRRRLEREDEEVDVLTVSEDVLRAMGRVSPDSSKEIDVEAMQLDEEGEEEVFTMPLLLEVDDSGAEEEILRAKEKANGENGQAPVNGSGSGKSSRSNSRPVTPAEETNPLQSLSAGSSRDASREGSRARQRNGVGAGSGESSARGSVRSGSKPGTPKGRKRKKRADGPS